MAKAPKPGKCVHCLRNPVPRTWDHVFPKAWYPTNATPNLYKWQIPACKRCNSGYGVLEDELQGLLGLCIDPTVAAASGVLEKARRAIDPRAAPNERESAVRTARLAKIMSERLTGDQIPTVGIYPGFHDRWIQPSSERAALRIPKANFEKLTEKIVRGIFYLSDRRFIEPPYSITFYALPQLPSELTEVLRQHGQVFAHEPGIRVTRAVAIEDGISSLFEIEIWGTFRMHASVSRVDPQSDGVEDAITP
jgi:hypothetical protein